VFSLLPLGVLNDTVWTGRSLGRVQGASSCQSRSTAVDVWWRPLLVLAVRLCLFGRLG